MMSMGVRSSLRLCSRTVRTARAVSMAVTQATECSTAERRILKPSLSCLRPLVGVIEIQVNGAALDHVQNVGVGLGDTVDPLALDASLREGVAGAGGGIDLHAHLLEAPAMPTISALSSSFTVTMIRLPRLGTFRPAPLKAFSRAWG